MPRSVSSSVAPVRIDPSYLLPGTQVGPYVVETRLGAGGMGATYRVSRDGEVFALKMATFAVELSGDERGMLMQRFRREVGALIGLEHPNIVAIRGYDIWPSVQNGFPYLVMEYVAGQELYAWVRKAKPSVRRIVQLFHSTALALHEVHRFGMLHRDLKSANLLVRDDDCEPVLIDFGISRPGRSKTVTRMQMLGTYTQFAPEYCQYLSSPECRAGAPFHFTPQTDLWAMGLMLHECLAGRPAFSFQEPEAEMMRAILQETPHLPSKVNGAVPSVLDEVVGALLQKEPTKRLASAELLAQRLASILEQEADASWEAAIAPSAPSVVVVHQSPSQASEVQPLSEVEPVLSEVTAHFTGPAAPLPQVASASEAEMPVPVPSPSPSVSLKEECRSQVGFVPPTFNHLRFQPPVVPVLAPAKTEETGRQLSIVRQLAKRLEGSGEVSAPRSRVPLFVLGGLGVAVAGILGLASMDRPQEKGPKPRMLLQQVHGGTSVADSSNEAASDAQQQLLAQPQRTMSEPVADSVTGVMPASPAPRKRNTDELAIDAELEAQFGRPIIPGQGAGPDGGVVAMVRSPSPSWLQRPAEELPPPAGDPNLPPVVGVSLGARIKARLLTNLDSRTIGDGPVEAVLVRPYIHTGKIVLPARTVLYGQGAAGGNGRFIVVFSKLKLPSQTVVPIDALAFDVNDGKPGLRASRVVAGDERQEGVGSKVAKGTANVLLGAVGGNTGAEVARNAGEAVVNQEARQNGYVQDALLLDGGGDFEVFVQSAF